MVRWVGVHWACRHVALLGLLWHVGTAAVWLGAQTPNRSAWVQAGVESGPAGTFLFTEAKRPGRRPVDHLRPWTLGDVTYARLQRRGNWWRAGVAGMWTRWVRLRDEEHCDLLELRDGAHAGATIGSSYVTG